MDELKLLVETVAGLPTLTIWVLAGYLLYKLCVIGSVYGVIKYAIQKFVEWRTMPPPPLAPIEYKFGGFVINEDVSLALIAQLQRLASTNYIHAADVTKLRKAIDYIEQKDEK